MAKAGGSGKLFVQVMIGLFVLVLTIMVPVFTRLIRDFFLLVLVIALDLGLIASLIANFVQYLRVRRLQEGEPPKAKPAPAAKPSKTPQAPSPARKPAVDPKILPDPGLVFRFDLAKAETSTKLIVIGQTEGSIKTYSTEVVNDHLQLEIRVRQDSDRDIYQQDELIKQSYQADLRRGARVMVHLPGMERFREMDARERLLVQEKPDQSGDFQFNGIDPRNPIRFQLGDRLRHDGKFIKGYFEFHLFTKDEEREVSGYRRLDRIFFLRLYKIFPGYDTGNPTEDGLYPMIDPFLNR
ncbi:MAG: hypothetical protein H7A21_01975 [Spirochaetales bacterium]|nr:hypothetical protein [Leptospiraceae bacterium]MCP5480174.1 hypothetical protein [Spirochaetales bacterium]MCP5485486.1 hypothetical protein [Spirochaetales bacterium]